MNSKSQNLALIYLSADLLAGVGFLKKLVLDLCEFGEIVTVSSVYKRYLNRRREDLNSELCTVVLLRSEASHEQLGQFLDGQQVERGQNASPATVRAVLLTFNNQVLLTPQRPLPHPQLHSDTLTMRCAAEIYGSYEHPVLGQTLNELVKSSESPASIEFFSQGRNLLGDMS